MVPDGMASKPAALIGPVFAVMHMRMLVLQAQQQVPVRLAPYNASSLVHGNRLPQKVL